MRDIKDVYWLAGLIEGGGYFCIQRRAPTTDRPAEAEVYKIEVNSTDRDVIDRVAAIIGRPDLVSEMRYGYNTFGYKINYRIGFTGKLAISWMMMLYPLMSARRKKKIREII